MVRILILVATSLGVVSGSYATELNNHLRDELIRDELTGVPDFFDLRFKTVPDDSTQGPFEQAVGFYSEGNLVNGMDFPAEGAGFVKIFRSRDRGWGSFDVISVVARSAALLAHAFPWGERVQIGDVSGRYGGSISGHASHQNGLDADLAFLHKDLVEQDAEDPRGFSESMVSDDGKIASNFDYERNWAFIKALLGTNRINRMFVNETIKKALCDYALSTGEFFESTEVLRRVRPWAGHNAHMHVRITCPKRSPHCVAQEEMPPGSGC